MEPSPSTLVLVASPLRDDRDEPFRHGLLRSAAKLGLLLKDGDDGQIAELVTAEVRGDPRQNPKVLKGYPAQS